MPCYLLTRSCSQQYVCWYSLFTKPGTLVREAHMYTALCSLLIWLHWVGGCGIPCDMPPCDKGIHIRSQHLIVYLFTLFHCMKKIVQSCKYVGLLGPALQSSGSTCLVLILHRQLGNSFNSSYNIFQVNFEFYPKMHLTSMHIYMTYYITVACIFN